MAKSKGIASILRNASTLPKLPKIVKVPLNHLSIVVPMWPTCFSSIAGGLPLVINSMLTTLGVILGIIIEYKLQERKIIKLEKRVEELEEKLKADKE